MFTLDSVQTTDSFPADGSSGGAMLIAQAGSNGGYAAVTTADVYVQLAYSPDGGVTLEWTPQVHVAPGNIILEKGTRGIRFKSYTAGTPATVSAGLSEPLEPSLQLASAGVATPAGATGAVQLIASQVLGAAQPSFDTNTILGGNIPQTYNHLRLMMMLRGTNASASITSQLRFNADASAAYDYVVGRWSGSSSGTAEVFAAAAVSLDNNSTPGATAGAGLFSQVNVDIDGYALPLAKVLDSEVTTKIGTASGNLQRVFVGGFWRNTSAVQRIQVLPNVGNFDAGSAFYLYGIT